MSLIHVTWFVGIVTSSGTSEILDQILDQHPVLTYQTTSEKAVFVFSNTCVRSSVNSFTFASTRKMLRSASIDMMTLLFFAWSCRGESEPSVEPLWRCVKVCNMEIIVGAGCDAGSFRRTYFPWRMLCEHFRLCYVVCLRSVGNMVGLLRCFQ